MFNFYIYFFLFFNLFFSYAKAVDKDMVLITAGEYTPLFKYGDISDSSKIYVKSFMINKYPITNSQFKEFVLNNPKWGLDKVGYIFADKNYLSHWENVDLDSLANHPVVNISWFAADAYCLYYGLRLPTIDEWEYVASAGVNNPNGRDEVNYLQDILDWYINSQVGEIVDVNNMTKNYWNIFGMHGVVWEWVSDFNSVILLNTDAEGGGLEELLYCGATATNAIDPADYVAFMRFAFRNALEANYTSSSLGFRCVKNVE